jgi:hypothetical protein
VISYVLGVISDVFNLRPDDLLPRSSVLAPRIFVVTLVG